MKWSERNKELIKMTIEDYKKDLRRKMNNRRYFLGPDDCFFCEEYIDTTCYGCPNVEINTILKLEITFIAYCNNNNYYIGAEYQKGKDRIGGLFLKSPKNIHLRIQFWEDALALTKKEFVRKYKKC